MPFFFDPGFETLVDPQDIGKYLGKRKKRSWKLKNAAGKVEAVKDSKKIRYGDYITHKVAHCFPDLFKKSKGIDVITKKK